MYKFDENDDIEYMSGIEYSKTIVKYEYKFTEPEPFLWFSDDTMCTLFTFIINDEMAVKSVNDAFGVRATDDGVLEYISTLINTGGNLMKHEDNLDIKVFYNINILIDSLANVVKFAEDNDDVKSVFKAFDDVVIQQLLHVKKLKLVNHHSLRNIFSVCSFCFKHVRGHADFVNLDFDFGIILFLYFGMKDVTRHDILINGPRDNEYVPIFYRKLQTFKL